jgi:hypothetical protein
MKVLVILGHLRPGTSPALPPSALDGSTMSGVATRYLKRMD